MIVHEFLRWMETAPAGMRAEATHALARAYLYSDIDEETRHELLADVVAESERLDRMLGNMLSLANVMAGRLPVVTEPVLLRPLARRAVESICGRSPLHTFSVDIPANFPRSRLTPICLIRCFGICRRMRSSTRQPADRSGQPRRSTASGSRSP